ncbi:MAG: hypothetical protein AAFX85_17100 [Pseudomonadota bacterium]
MSPVVLGVLAAVLLGLGVATWKAPRLTSALIWTFVGTMLISAALMKVFPGEFRGRVFSFALFMPVLWVGLQFWLYWDRSRWRPTLAVIGLSVVSAGVVVLTGAPA